MDKKKLDELEALRLRIIAEQFIRRYVETEEELYLYLN